MANEDTPAWIYPLLCALPWRMNLRMFRQGRLRNPRRISHLELCTSEGLRNTVVTRKDKAAFRQARDVRWGDALEDK